MANAKVETFQFLPTMSTPTPRFNFSMGSFFIKLWKLQFRLATFVQIVTLNSKVCSIGDCAVIEVFIAEENDKATLSSNLGKQTSYYVEFFPTFYQIQFTNNIVSNFPLSLIWVVCLLPFCINYNLARPSEWHVIRLCTIYRYRDMKFQTNT